jgi:hypothetical protein
LFVPRGRSRRRWRTVGLSGNCGAPNVWDGANAPSRLEETVVCPLFPLPSGDDTGSAGQAAAVQTPATTTRRPAPAANAGAILWPAAHFAMPRLLGALASPRGRHAPRVGPAQAGPTVAGFVLRPSPWAWAGIAFGLRSRRRCSRWRGTDRAANFGGQKNSWWPGIFPRARLLTGVRRQQTEQPHERSAPRRASSTHSGSGRQQTSTCAVPYNGAHRRKHW